MKNWPISLRCFWGLLCLEAALFRVVVVDRLINFFLWGGIVIWVSAYLLPLFGMPAQYGAFTAVGVLVSAGVFEAYGRVIELVTQMSNDCSLLYYATLPLATHWMILRIMLVNALRSITLSILILPVAKLILGTQLVLDALQIIPALLMFIIINLFTGVAAVWIAAQAPSVLGLSNVWMRKVFPFWFLGGFQFTQSALLKVFPAVAWLNFLNPLIYATEGMRAAVLGQEEYLNVWVCFGVLILWTIFAAWRGIVLMKRRLDLI